MSSIYHPGLNAVWTGDVSLGLLVFVVFAVIVLGANALLIRSALHRPTILDDDRAQVMDGWPVGLMTVIGMLLVATVVFWEIWQRLGLSLY